MKQNTKAPPSSMNEQPVEEQLLSFPDGRVLAYASAGATTSSCAVIFFHGAFGVGAAANPLSPALAEKNVHFVAPTLPGWGNTSPVPPHIPFHEQLCQDISALLSHLHPSENKLELYISGGSFGTVPAQILYGASYDIFPAGRHIRGMLLLAPFSPFRVHKEYTKCLSWINYIAIGSVGRIIPFELASRLARLVMKNKTDTRDHAEAFLQDFVFKNMAPAERKPYEDWKAAKGIRDGEEMKRMSDGVYRSVQESWDGFMTMPDIAHSDWGGYSPEDLDNEHSKPVLLFLTKEDWEMTRMGEWLASKLKNTRVRYGEGGHVGSLFVMDDIWEDFMSQFP